MNKANNANDNFRAWKQLVGLKDTFPQLSRIALSDFERYFYLPPHHKEPVSQIELQLGSRERLAIIFEQGHGCTTFHDYLMQLTMRDAARRRLVPISVRFSDSFWRDGSSSADFFELFRQGLVKGLVGYPWDKVLSRSDYYTLIDGFDHEERMATVLVVINAAIRRAEQSNGSVDWTDLAEKGFDFNIPLAGLVKRFRDVQLRPLLFVDTSHSGLEPSGSVGMRKIVSSIKSLIDDQVVGPHGASLAMFTTKKDLRYFQQGDVNYRWDKIELPRYTYGEIFAILNHHYNWSAHFDSAATIGNLDLSKLPLSAIVNQDFIKEAAEPGGTVVEIIGRLEKVMLSMMDRPWNQIPFVLNPPRGTAE
jgi:hypothetical protein